MVDGSSMQMEDGGWEKTYMSPNFPELDKMHGKKESAGASSKAFDAVDLELLGEEDWEAGDLGPDAGVAPGEKLPDAGFFNQFDDDFDESDIAI